MACNQTLSGLVRDCAPSMGGVKRVLFANADDVTAVTVSNDKVSAITMATSAKFKEYALPKGTANFVTTLNKDEANGTMYYATTLALVFNRMMTNKRVEISALAQNDLVAIVEDMNGLYWLMGKDEPLTSTSGDVAQSGTARADRNGYAISFIDNSKEMPYEVDADIIDALVG